jgi:hypothetical protein
MPPLTRATLAQILIATAPGSALIAQTVHLQATELLQPVFSLQPSMLRDSTLEQVSLRGI